VEQKTLLTLPFEEGNTIYNGFVIYQEKSSEPWSPHTNGLYGFLLKLVHSYIDHIKRSPLEKTYELWNQLLSDLDRIVKEVPYRMKQKIYKVIDILDGYDSAMVRVHADNLVKHHHVGANISKHRSRNLREREKKLDELNRALFKPPY